MTIYDTQSHHGGISSIRYLSRVASEGERTNAGEVYYSQQRYDTVDNQTCARDLLSRRLPALRATREGQRAAGAPLIERLSALVDHAYESTAFYRRVYAAAGFRPGDIRTLDDFKALPVIEKSDLRSIADSERIDQRGAPNLYTSRTSGSSGAPLNVAYSDDQYVMSMSNYIWQMELALGKPLDPERWIYNIHHARWWLSSVLGRYRTFAVNDLPPLDALKQHLQQLRPQVIVALPSYVAALAAAQVDLASYGVEAITTNSEQSLPEERRQYERQFGMPVRDEYSSVELEQIAFECSCGRYHIFEDNVYVETIDTDEHGVGAIVGTSLYAAHMPMIRYNQGDLGVLATSPCLCGAQTDALEHIHGRRNASFVTRDGRVVPSASILGIVDDFLVRFGSGVETYRLYQTSVDELTLYHTGSSLCADVRAMTQQLERLLGHTVALETRHVDQLPQHGSYKRQLLVSLVGERLATTHS